jgi:ubiquinone/menaquinone biosynthesis C-methylase UbiE
MNDGPRSVDELAAATRCHPPSLYRLLRALGSAGVFLEVEPQRFVTTPVGETLATSRPATLRYFAMAELGQEHFSAWEEFPYSIQTGHMAFLEKFKQPVWQYYATHAADAEAFNQAMSAFTEGVTQAILPAYDFSPFHKIVDVGGGLGTFLTALLAAAPSAKGVLFDSAAVIGDAAQARAAGIDDRVERVAGNFLEAVPMGGDLYTLKMILHDWTDTECVSILSNIRKAIAPGGKVIIVEMVIGPGADAKLKNFIDLNMLVMTGGRERTEPEFRDLLEKAGFKFSRVIATASPMSLIEGMAG